MAATTVGVGPRRLEGSIMQHRVAATISEIFGRLLAGPVFIYGPRPIGPWSSQAITMTLVVSGPPRLVFGLGNACPSLMAKSCSAYGQTTADRSYVHVATLRPYFGGLHVAVNGRRLIGRALLAKASSVFGQILADHWCGLCSRRRHLPLAV